MALSIGSGVKAVRPDQVDLSQAAGLELLVVGSPTHGGGPTERISRFIDSISAELPPGIRVAAFDTRLKMKFARLFGFAADKIVAAFTQQDARIAGAGGFVVKGRAGPLAQGEVQRAANWGRQLAL